MSQAEMQTIHDLNNIDWSKYNDEEILGFMEQLTFQVQARHFIKANKVIDRREFERKYKELLKEPPTKFACKNGVITLRKELVKNIIVAIKHLVQELDAVMLFVGREGSGKSLFVRQILYAYWWFLREFGLVEYTFDIALVHFGIEELQEDRVHYDLELGLKFRISDLDESKDDLGRDKHNDPKTVGFLNYLRRCREESGVFGLLQPWLSEFLPSIVLSRTLMIFEVEYDLDAETGDIIRGEYKLIIIPRGKTGYSYYHGKRLSRQEILNTISDHLYNAKLRYAPLPDKIIFLRGEFNRVDPIDTKDYQDKKKLKKWDRIYKKREEEKEIKRKLREYDKLIEQRNVLMQIIKDNNIENDEIADYMGVSVRSVQRLVNKAGVSDR